MIGSLCLGMIMGFSAATAFVALAGGGFWSWLAIYMLSGMLGTAAVGWCQVACRQARETEALGQRHRGQAGVVWCPGEKISSPCSERQR